MQRKSWKIYIGYTGGEGGNWCFKLCQQIRLYHGKTANLHTTGVGYTLRKVDKSEHALPESSDRGRFFSSIFSWTNQNKEDEVNIKWNMLSRNQHKLLTINDITLPDTLS